MQIWIHEALTHDLDPDHCCQSYEYMSAPYEVIAVRWRSVLNRDPGLKFMQGKFVILKYLYCVLFGEMKPRIVEISLLIW